MLLDIFLNILIGCGILIVSFVFIFLFILIVFAIIVTIQDVIIHLKDSNT